MVITFTSCCRAADVLALHWRLLLFWVLLLRSLLLFLFGVGVVATSVADVRDTCSSCSCCSWSPSSRLEIRNRRSTCVQVFEMFNRGETHVEYCEAKLHPILTESVSPSICGCLVQHSPSKPVASGSSRSRECWLWLNGFRRCRWVHKDAENWKLNTKVVTRDEQVTHRLARKKIRYNIIITDNTLHIPDESYTSEKRQECRRNINKFKVVTSEPHPSECRGGPVGVPMFWCFEFCCVACFVMMRGDFLRRSI